MERKKKILIVDDEEKMLRALRDFFGFKGYDTFTAVSGNEAIELFRDNKKDIDIVLLDIMLPDKDGFTVLKEIRKISFMTPVIMVTAKGAEYDQLQAFSEGADDYVTKPFLTSLLLARVEANLRRNQNQTEQEIKVGDLLIKPTEREIFLNQEPLSLTRREYELLYFLIENEGIIFSRDQLLDQVWGYDFYGGKRTVDTHIRNLRKKLEGYDYIKTEHCIGYKFEV